MSFVERNKRIVSDLIGRFSFAFVNAEDALRVRDADESELLAVEGVQVGVSEEAGGFAIKVYVEHADDARRARLPDRLDEVPAVVEELVCSRLTKREAQL